MIERIRTMANANIGGKIPDWLWRAAVPIVVAAFFLAMCGAAVEDHAKIQDHESRIATIEAQQAAYRSLITDMAQAKSDIAYIKSQQDDMRTDQRETLNLLISIQRQGKRQ
jgi:hypothetical protein